MRKNKFENEERSLLESFEKDQWHSAPSLEKEIVAYRAFAKAQIEKKRQINLSLSKEDWDGIQRKAREEGMPSEVLISNIVHQFVRGASAQRRVT